MQKHLIITCLAAALLLSGCQRGIHVEVGGTSEAFNVSLSWAGVGINRGPLCVRSVGLTDAVSEFRTAIWQINSTTDCATTNRITYRGPNAGFQVLHAPEPLVEGRTYELGVLGPGSIGTCQFRIQNHRVQVIREHCS